MESDWARVIQSGLQLAFNSIPLAVGVNILSKQEKTLKETLAAQDKSQKDLMDLNIKSLKDILARAG